MFFSETFLQIFFSSSTRLVEDLLVQEAMYVVIDLNALCTSTPLQGLECEPK